MFSPTTSRRIVSFYLSAPNKNIHKGEVLAKTNYSFEKRQKELAKKKKKDEKRQRKQGKQGDPSEEQVETTDQNN